MIISELEAERLLDAGELRVCQPRRDRTTSGLHQATRRLRAQPGALTDDHARTLAPTALEENDWRPSTLAVTSRPVGAQAGARESGRTAGSTVSA